MSQKPRVAQAGKARSRHSLIKPDGESFGANGTAQTSYGYAGEPTDGNQLVHLRRRYLSPGLGQFISRDPLEVFNRYAYRGTAASDTADIPSLQIA